MGKVLSPSFWKTAAVFAVIGPFVGGLVVGFVGMSSNFGGLTDGSVQLEDLTALFLWGLVGYPFGIIPAILTGVIAGAISPKVPSGLAWVVLCTGVGAVVSGLAASISASRLDPFTYFAGIGAVAVLVSTAVGLRLRPR